MLKNELNILLTKHKDKKQLGFELNLKNPDHIFLLFSCLVDKVENNFAEDDCNPVDTFDDA